MNNEENKQDDIYTVDIPIDPELSKKIELRGHRWKQQGPHIICKSCDMRHAYYIGIDKQLVGINKEGYPLFAKRS